MKTDDENIIQSWLDEIGIQLRDVFPELEKPIEDASEDAYRGAISWDTGKPGEHQADINAAYADIQLNRRLPIGGGKMIYHKTSGINSTLLGTRIYNVKLTARLKKGFYPVFEDRFYLSHNSERFPTGTFTYEGWLTDIDLYILKRWYRITHYQSKKYVEFMTRTGLGADWFHNVYAERAWNAEAKKYPQILYGLFAKYDGDHRRYVPRPTFITAWGRLKLAEAIQGRKDVVAVNTDAFRYCE